MAYADGYLIAVPKKNIEKYRKIAEESGKIWKEYGATDYKETMGDDLRVDGMPTSFLDLLQAKPTETVIFSWIVYESRAKRDEVNAAVMKDKRIADMCGNNENMPFDMKRMYMGGFEIIVDAFKDAAKNAA